MKNLAFHVTDFDFTYEENRKPKKNFSPEVIAMFQTRI